MNIEVGALTKDLASAPRHPWRALFWEPVAGTGERLMVGVVHGYGGRFDAVRLLRDDVFDGLFGKSADGARKLIDAGLRMYAEAATAENSLASLDVSLMGLHPAECRVTSATSLADMLRTAALLYSSLANLDRIDMLDEEDAPSQEEVNRRFSTEVRDVVLQRNHSLAKHFGKAVSLGDGGIPVRFGYASTRLVLHFGVLHPVRSGASIRDARARLLELEQARAYANVPRAALIGAVPRDDDATLGDHQREQVRQAIREIGANAKRAGVTYFPVSTVIDGANCLMELA